MKFGEARKLITHPVACIDCHDSQTMALRSRAPASWKACAP
jgi:nitrite reductase (cytochrome c-552)